MVLTLTFQCVVSDVSGNWVLLASRDEIVSYIDEIIVNTKKLIKATSKEMEKWRRP